MSIEYYIAAFNFETGSNYIPNGDMEADSYWANSGEQSSLWYSTSYYLLPSRSLAFNVAPTSGGGESNQFFHPAPIGALYPGSLYQIDGSFLHLSGGSGLKMGVLLSDASSIYTSIIIGPGDTTWRDFRHVFQVSSLISNPILRFELEAAHGQIEISSSFVATDFTTWSETDPRNWGTVTPTKITVAQVGGYGSPTNWSRPTSFDIKTLNFKIEVSSYGSYIGGDEFIRITGHLLRGSQYTVNVQWRFQYSNLRLVCGYYGVDTSSIGLPYERYCTLSFNETEGQAKLDLYTDSNRTSLDTTLVVSHSDIAHGVIYEYVLSNYNCPYESFVAAIEDYGSVEMSESFEAGQNQTYLLDQIYFGPFRGWENIGVLQIYPGWDMKREVVQNRADHRTKGGRLYSYQWGDYERFTIPLDYVQNSKAAIINSWWASDALIWLKIYSGGVWETNTCYLMNDRAPFQDRKQPYSQYKHGMLRLETF